MTKLLEQAIERVSKLSASDQDAVAVMVLEELASERRWDDSFAKSQDALAKMAAQALAEYDAGQSKPL